MIINVYMLPPEITDHILSFCDGYIRADLRVKNVRIPIKHNLYDLGEKLLLENNIMTVSDGVVNFINKRNTMWAVGYVSKMVKDSEILYMWVRVQWF